MTTAPSIAEAGLEPLWTRLRTEGLILDFGTAVVRVRSSNKGLARQLQQVYGAFPFAARADFCDIDARIAPVGGLRRLLRPQVRFLVDGIAPFEPFPADSALPLFEWGVNWTMAMRMNQHLLLHAGVVAQGDRAAILAALPGSGKSTLTAALMLSGLRLLSDEFGVVCLASGSVRPMIKAVALKNRSIALIRDRFPSARLGPVFPKTRKGDVAHLAPDAPSVALRKLGAEPVLILFPRYEAGSTTRVTPMSPTQAFARLAFNSFNYALLGPDGFRSVTRLIGRAPAHDLRYSRIDEAVATIARLLIEPAGEAAA